MLREATASIHRQVNTSFIQDINIHIDKLLLTIKTEYNNDILDGRSNFKKVHNLAKKLKQTSIESELSKISDILSNRFNIRLTIRSLGMKDYKLSSLIIPNLNFKILDIALKDIDTLFPSRQFNELLWNTTTNINETTIYKTLDNITKTLRSDSIKIDLEEAMVYGLEDSEFIINLDFFKAVVLEVEPEELSSLLIYEVGRIFTYLENMTNTTNTTLTLLDTFINERFTKQTETIEAIELSMQKANPDYTFKNASLKIVEELDTYIINTFKLEQDKDIVKRDYSRGGDIFATRFGLADKLASLITKRATDGSIDSLSTNYAIDFIIDILSLIVFIITMIILFLFGLVIFVTYLAFTIVKYVLTFILKSIFNIFSFIFRLKNDKPSYDLLKPRLKKIKLELIRELRTLDVTKEDKRIIVNQIDFISDIIKTIDSNVHKLNKYGYIPNSLDELPDINDILESLEESEFYLYKSKLELLKGK